MAPRRSCHGLLLCVAVAAGMFLVPALGATCADIPGRICNDWKNLGNCAVGFVSNGKSIRDELCPVTCGGACTKNGGGGGGNGGGAACADIPGRICNDWKTQNFCAPGFVSNGKSIRDELCPVTCGGACTKTAGTCANVAACKNCKCNAQCQCPVIAPVARCKCPANNGGWACSTMARCNVPKAAGGCTCDAQCKCIA